MVKGVEKLTDRQVRNLKTHGRYPDGATLYLVVWPSGSKSWGPGPTAHHWRATG